MTSWIVINIRLLYAENITNVLARMRCQAVPIILTRLSDTKVTELHCITCQSGWHRQEHYIRESSGGKVFGLFVSSSSYFHYNTTLLRRIPRGIFVVHQWGKTSDFAVSLWNDSTGFGINNVLFDEFPWKRLRVWSLLCQVELSGPVITFLTAWQCPKHSYQFMVVV